MAAFEIMDMSTWNRAHYFKSYEGGEFPYINLGARVDVTRLLEVVRREGLSSYFAMIHTANSVADEIENFHYRIHEGKAVRVEKNIPVLTHMRPGDDVFFMLKGLTDVGVREFCEDLSKKAEHPPEKEERLDVGVVGIISYSCIPWVDYTHFVRTITKLGEDSNPKISWGKYVTENGRTTMNFSVQVHHGLMDGWHVGQYFMRLQERLDNFCI